MFISCIVPLPRYFYPIFSEDLSWPSNYDRKFYSTVFRFFLKIAIDLRKKRKNEKKKNKNRLVSFEDGTGNLSLK